MSTVPKMVNGSSVSIGEKWSTEENMKYNHISKLTARSYFDFPFFVNHVLGYDYIYSSKLNQEFHFEPSKYIFDKRFILIIWPRGFLKTSIWTEAYITWKLWREKGFKIGIVSSALDQSQRIINNIQNLITGNEFLSGLYDKNLKWNMSEINTKNGNECVQLPFSSSARGNHLDLLVVDDILREENLTQEQIKDYFWSIFFPMTQTRKGQIIIAGTPMTMKDLYADLQNLAEEKKNILEKFNLDCKIIKKACVEVDNHGKWIRSSWPERYSLDELEAMKSSQGSLTFEREYMVSPMGGGASIFKNIKIGNHSELDKALPTENYYMGVDVAMKSGAKNDFLVFSILGKDTTTGMIKQRKLERYKGWGENEIINRIKILHSKFNFKRVLMENAGLSVGLVKSLTDRNKYPELCNVCEGFVSNSRKNKEELISVIAVGFETGVLSVLDNTVQYNELVSFKAKEDTRTGKVTYEGVGQNDDTCIALGLGMKAIQLDIEGSSSIDFI